MRTLATGFAPDFQVESWNLTRLVYILCYNKRDLTDAWAFQQKKANIYKQNIITEYLAVKKTASYRSKECLYAASTMLTFGTLLDAQGGV